MTKSIIQNRWTIKVYRRKQETLVRARLHTYLPHSAYIRVPQRIDAFILHSVSSNVAMMGHRMLDFMHYCLLKRLFHSNKY